MSPSSEFGTSDPFLCSAANELPSHVTQVWSGVSPQLLKTSICERGSLALLVLPSWSQTWTMTPQLLTQAICTTADD